MSLLLFLLILQDDPARLVEGLRADDPAERKRAFQRLRDLGATARPHLEKAAADGDPDVAGQARSLLRILQLRENLPLKVHRDHPGLADQLATGSDEFWAETFDRLLPNADIDLLDVLASQALRAEGSLGAYYRMAVAGDLGLASGLPDLLRTARENDDRPRAAALQGLVMLGDGRQSHWAYRLGRRIPEEPAPERNARVRRIAGGMLPDLRKALEHDDPALRGALLHLLAFVQERESVPVLLAHVKDASPRVRATAVLALIRLKAPELVPALAPILGQIPEHPRIPVIQEIGRSGVRAYAPVLAGQLLDGSAAVRGHALVALARLRSEAHLPEIRRHVESPDGNLRWFALQALAAWGDPKDAPVLIRALQDEDIQIRWAAIEGLGELRAAEALPFLEPLTRSAHQPTRERALKAMEKIRPENRK